MAKPPATPPAPKKEALPENHVRVKHKVNGKELVVNKAYLEKNSDTLEAV